MLEITSSANTQMETMPYSAPKGNEKAPQFQGFAKRHLGPNPVEIQQMLELLGVSSLETLIDQTIPSTIRLNYSLKLPEAQTGLIAQRLRQVSPEWDLCIRGFRCFRHPSSGCQKPPVEP